MAQVAVTVRPETATLCAPTLVPPSTKIWKAAPGGTAFSSSASWKVTVSVVPFIAALTNSGGVVSAELFVTGMRLKFSASFPSKSRSGSYSGFV